MPLDAVAKELEASVSKLVRIESGAVTVSPGDLRVLLDLYGVTGSAERGELLLLGRQARQRSWTGRYHDRAPAGLLRYADYESEARQIHQHHPLVIPPLLQTSAYAATLAEAGVPRLRRKYRDGYLDLLAERQWRIFTLAAAELAFVVDETALARPIGGPDVHRKQLTHLLEVAEHPRARIVSLPVGPYPGLDVPFTMLTLSTSDTDLAFVDEPGGVDEIQEAVVGGYRRAFGWLLGTAVDARPVIERLRAELYVGAGPGVEPGACGL
ncbi:helix-turn-helix domain-containing protein [Plantactinospora sp. S1510]|uniref:Helix-turn-helix domain-containing protein n=2 Tax=Plantactinospora alkalitolerans TaxID=2789879 RepID=A0ABS0H9S6_9ACTN|nr:helix-turn-helix domain-containing protein [Plantactinospora alkalitolerans]